jgi:hypothetical protein
MYPKLGWKSETIETTGQTGLAPCASNAKVPIFSSGSRSTRGSHLKRASRIHDVKVAAPLFEGLEKLFFTQNRRGISYKFI